MNVEGSILVSISRHYFIAIQQHTPALDREEQQNAEWPKATKNKEEHEERRSPAGGSRSSH